MGMDDQLFVDKLNEYGLTIDDAKNLGISYLNADDTNKLGNEFKKNKSLTIPYRLPDGSGLLENGESAPFYRVQYLYSDDKKTLTSKIGKQSTAAPVFAQAHKTTNHLYFPSITKGFAWADVLSNTAMPIVITDGELKAAKGCKEGLPTVSVGNAESFRDVQNGRLLLREFELFDLLKRDVYVAYDSDFKSSDRVLGVLASMADELEACGALVKTVVLPGTIGDGKVCLGGFLANQSVSAFLALTEQAVPYGITKELFKMNNKFCYVCNPSAISQQGISDLLSQEKFKNNLANKRSLKQSIRKGGDIDFAMTPLVQEWISWPLRNTTDRLCYEPGKDRYISSSYNNQPIREYNTWLGWGCEPAVGDVSDFLVYFNALTSNVTDDQRYWLLSWLAYPLQHSGTKMPSCVCLYGRKHGTGKSLLGYIMAAIYGENFGEINQKLLEGNFTEWAIDNNFILADDVTGSKKRDFADLLKVLVSQRKISINRKNIALYSQRDVINYLFTTNQANAFYLEDSDRRFFVCEVENEILCDSFLQKIRSKYIDGDGGAYLFDYLMKHDLSKFNPFSPPPVTAAKASMLDMGMSDLASFVRTLRDHPEQFGNDIVGIMTSNEILKLYKRQEDVSDSGKRNITANGIAREMVAAGIDKLQDGKQFRLKGKVLRFFIIKDKEYWSNASLDEIRDRVEPYKEAKLHDAYS